MTCRCKTCLRTIQHMLIGILSAAGLLSSIGFATTEARPAWKFEETGRLAAEEARQGVAADGTHLFAIGNHAIGKYRKDTGERVAHWSCAEGDPLTHLNAGLVIGGQLFGAHSNYPAVPHRSSIEIWDTSTLRHVRSIDLGETDGSLTWIDRRDGSWIACFVHYAGRGGVPGKGPEFTRLVELDHDWQVVRTWRLPKDLITDLSGRGYSVSGGAIGPDGRLYVTGHDETKLYVLRFPSEGEGLTWIGTIAIPAEGQAFAWDPVETGVIHLILKRTRQIITGRIRLLAPGQDTASTPSAHRRGSATASAP
jgi:hypothetical protein